jgi:hypothetical protein
VGVAGCPISAGVEQAARSRESETPAATTTGQDLIYIPSIQSDFGEVRQKLPNGCIFTVVVAFDNWASA